MNSSPVRRTEHSDFLDRFAKRLANSGSDVYKHVPHNYWSAKDGRTIRGRIDLVAVKNGSITAYQLLTENSASNPIEKLAGFECNAAYSIAHNGQSRRIK